MNPLFVTVSSWITCRNSGAEGTICESEEHGAPPTARACLNRRLANPQVARFRGGEIAQGRACAVWLKVGAPEISSGPGWEIQEVSRVGAQGVTSKSKLLAREMPDLHTGGLRVDSEAAKSLKVAPAQSGSKSMRRSSPRDLDGRAVDKGGRGSERRSKR